MDRPSHRLALDQILHLETHDQTIQQLFLNGAKSRAIPEACNINAKKHMSTNLQSLAYSLSGSLPITKCNLSGPRRQSKQPSLSKFINIQLRDSSKKESMLVCSTSSPSNPATYLHKCIVSSNLTW